MGEEQVRKKTGAGRRAENELTLAGKNQKNMLELYSSFTVRYPE